MPQNHCFHGIPRTFWVVQASPEVSMVIPQIPSASQKTGHFGVLGVILVCFLLIPIDFLLNPIAQDLLYPCFDCSGEAV